MIFKIQIPLISNEDNPMALAYNKERDVQGMFPVSEELLELCDGKPKIYVDGTLDQQGRIIIDEVVDDQDF